MSILSKNSFVQRTYYQKAILFYDHPLKGKTQESTRWDFEYEIRIFYRIENFSFIIGFT